VILPDGRCDIILLGHINSAEPQTPIITGPATTAYTVTYDAGDCWTGIRLRPGNARALWQHRIAEAENAVLFGPDAVDLLPHLLKPDQSALALDAIDTLLRNKIPSPSYDILHRALDAVHASGGRLSIASLARLAGCTARHLNRVFRTQVGLGTKTYAQLVQFHRTLRLIQKEELPLSSAAAEGGYADHAHLTRAFRRFGGFTPSALPAELAVPSLFG
jgi:AraC-like DNA-binding protein